MIAVAEVAPLLRSLGAVAPPPTPVLSIADRGDGSGAVATIAAAPAGGAASVLIQRFGGELSAGSWRWAGERTGSGSVDLALTPGHYFAHALVTSAAGAMVSGVVYFAVTDGLESIHTRCLEGAQARIRLLLLAGLDGEQVVVEKFSTNRGAARLGLPAIVLSPARAAMPATAGTNGLDDVHYDVLVAILDRDNQEPTQGAHLDRHLLWRQQIARAFRNQRLPGVPEVIDTVVDSAEGISVDAWKRELLASALVLRFVSREHRGF